MLKLLDKNRKDIIDEFHYCTVLLHEPWCLAWGISKEYLENEQHIGQPSGQEQHIGQHIGQEQHIGQHRGQEQHIGQHMTFAKSCNNLTSCSQTKVGVGL